jgi:hypothetical protein
MSAWHSLRSSRPSGRPILGGLLACLLCLGGVARAQESAIGTFTVNGKTVRFSNIYATLESAPGEPKQRYLIMLVSDAPVAAGDRTPSRLQSAAAAGTLHAVRIRWKYGVDEIAVAPYHRDVAESGKAVPGVATLNLTALNDTNVHAEFKSKMLGQTWHFNALVKAAIAKGGEAELEPEVEVTSTSSTTGAKDPTTLKRQLGSMGYEFTPDAFFQAIGDHKPQAVALFLQAGMSPNQKNDQKRFALNHAVLFCANAPEDAAAVIAALVAGKADVKVKDPDNGTTALVGAVQSCPPSAIDVLVKAGSDLTAKSNGGMTALQLAKIFGRSDVTEVLTKAGAK